MTHEININGIIIRLRNLSASLNKLIKTQKIMPNEKEKVIHISLRSSGSVISRMIEAETEKLRKKDWVKIYMEKEDYEAMVQADGQLAEKLSRLSDNVKFIVMEDGKRESCIIEMPDEIIDMSVDTQLENIHRLVDNANT